MNQFLSNMQRKTCLEKLKNLKNPENSENEDISDDLMKGTKKEIVWIFWSACISMCRTAHIIAEEPSVSVCHPTILYSSNFQFFSLPWYDIEIIDSKAVKMRNVTMTVAHEFFSKDSNINYLSFPPPPLTPYWMAQSVYHPQPRSGLTISS